MNFSFVPLHESHMKLLFLWLNSHHVKQWYGKKEDFSTIENVKSKYLPRTLPDSKVQAFVIYDGPVAVGYIQTYRITDFEEYNAHVQTTIHSAGIDLFIGNEKYLHKGYGSGIIEQFLNKIVFQMPEINTCIIGPEPQNTAAIRAYEKAGFNYYKTIHLPDETEPEYLMVLKNDEFLKRIKS